MTQALSAELSGFSYNTLVAYPDHINVAVDGAGGSGPISSPPVTITLKNTSGTSTGVIQPISTSAFSGNPLLFSINAANNTCTGNTLAAGASCTFEVIYTASSNGETQNFVFDSITDNVGTIEANWIVLRGVAENFGPALELVSSSQVTGLDVIGSTGTQTTVEVRNISGADTDRINFSFGGQNPSSFVVLTDNCTSQTIANNATCTYLLESMASGDGSFSTEMNIGLNGGTELTVALSGDASGFSDSPEKILSFMKGTLPTEIDNFVTASSTTFSRTFLNEDGFYEFQGVNTPRFDFDTDGHPAGLLIEGYIEQHLNRNNNLTHNRWDTPNNGSAEDLIKSTTETGPILGETVFLMEEVGNPPYELNQIMNVSQTVDTGLNTLSIFIKAKERNKFEMGFNDHSSPGDSLSCQFSLDGTQVGTTPTMTGNYTKIRCDYQKLRDGWYRISVTGNVNNSARLKSFFRILDENGDNNYTLPHTNFGIYITSPQLESSPEMTSFTINENNDSSKGFFREVGTSTSNFSWYDSSTNEATFLFDAKTGYTGSGSENLNQLKLLNDVNAEEISWFVRPFSNDLRIRYNDASNVENETEILSLKENSINKLMLSQSTQEIFSSFLTISTDGAEEQRETVFSGTLYLSTLNRIEIGDDPSDYVSRHPSLHLREFTYWKSRKSPEQLNFASQEFKVVGVTGSFDKSVDNLFEIDSDSSSKNLTVHWSDIFDEDYFDVTILDSSFNEIPGCEILNVPKNSSGATLTNCSWSFGTKYYVNVKAYQNNDKQVYLQGENIYFGFTVEKSCPTNYVKVRAFEPHTTKNFCVAKYEMKPGVISEPDNLPDVNVTKSEAVTRCDQLGANYQLISNGQWQTIAKNIELNPTNWNSNEVGDGQINSGNTDNETHTGSPGALAASSLDHEGCFGTGQEIDNAGGNYNCPNGWSTQKRTHELLNGQIIWDIGGNVTEWVRDDLGEAYHPGDSSLDRVFSTMLDYTRDKIDFDGIGGTPEEDLRFHFGPQLIYDGTPANNYSGLGVNDFQGETGTPAIFRGGEYTGWAGLVSTPDFRERSGIYSTKLTLDAPAWNWPTTGYRCVFEDSAL